MLRTNLINADLVRIGMEANTKEEVLKNLARLFISKGYVEEEYLEAILERERAFPTGLTASGLGVAIPHADSEYVIKPGIAVAILKESVKFRVMGEPDEEVDVKLVFMLSIKDPNQQINLLKELVSIFRNGDLLLRLAETQDERDFVSIINSVTRDE